MTVEEIQANLEKLRTAFITFLDVVISIDALDRGKHMACLRFDEGHMWMQNAIMSYQETPKD
ncbi:hypothetical protein UFOVP98_23 [uncultured Caudovirales phage]|jgi:hypothetical protein|uniref:Uncharacterized protein n=1 Tax=uncultured Caudovirales phage TaxID=2100421 RepID=A0A6J5LJP8_9CAUD|nr:hypothetical protein UFOVP98_23 [uncultured Caudovirales phage]CAB4134411.1 hypothetical protein UFOVP269_47 [uncultured Caudovirales phage]